MGVPIKCISFDQTGAPQLSGEAGKLDAILYAALVTGINPQSITSLTVVANVATVTTSVVHGYQVNDVILISGANESVFNDEFVIVSIPTTTSFTFAITTTTTPATGTISCKIAPLGWSQVFTDTNKSIYQSNDQLATKLYLKVDDTGAKSTQVNIYETVSTIDIGTGKSTDIWWGKSSIANTTTRQWYLVGDSKRFYLMTEINLSYTIGLSIYFFGDIIPFRANDPWCCALGGHSAIDPSVAVNNTGMLNVAGTTTGMVLARSASWLGGSVPFGMYSVTRHTVMGYAGSVPSSFPSSADNKIHLFPVYVYDSQANVWRGEMPAMYCPAEYPNGVYLSKERHIIDNKTYMSFRLNMGSSATVWGNYFLSLDSSDWS